MSWGVAQIRGVPFWSNATEITVGQRRAVYEFPFDGKGAAGLDLGRRARKYQVEALLFPGQEDVYKRLLEALEAPGPALFVHPTRGPVMVVIAPEITLRETTDEMVDDEPMVRFTFTATESRQRAPVPAPVTDAKSAVAGAAVSVRSAAQQSMQEGTRLQGVQEFIRQAHLDTLDTVLSDIALLNGTISAALAVPGTFASQIESISRQIQTLLDFPDTLFDAIDGALSTIIASVNAVSNSGVNAFVRDVTSPDAASASLSTLSLTIRRGALLGSSDEIATVPGVTEIETVNKAVTLRALRASALTACCEAALDAPYSSHDEAADTLTKLTTQIDALAQGTIVGEECVDILFEALQGLRSALFKGLSALELVGTVEYTPGETSDASVIAYNLYGDADRADEIAERSGSGHPGFIPGGRTFRVLER